ncbi:hypothetical protein AK830_g4454 [Neonectria ditissima]|uniref:PD-(D/E)XK nuclease-like domain-containing protein n=1 Tax=Neonectria ditissima TaxID=78410 RepID=A0A0N8H7L4_9HYPO|nr:hypothetical protein AK830_g4454 [Neonectria ditissima]
MNAADFITSWLEDLPDLVNHPCKGSHKRKLAAATNESEQLTSPPASNQTDINNNREMASTPNKRRRHEYDGSGAALDADATPRPGARTAPSSSASLSQSLSASSSVASGASSPKKQMMRLQLSESGVEFKALSVDSCPELARHLISSMDDIGRGHDILEDSEKSHIMHELEARHLNLSRWRYSFQPAGQVDALPGRTPTFREVERIWNKAKECQEYSHEETSWNSQVQLRLLESIFENDVGERCDLFGAMSCTTARPHRQFKLSSSPIKMVDICVYASLDKDDAISTAIAEFSRTTPTETVNHTDFMPISARPLVLSIETKKPGVHWDTAQLQVGVWHASQWGFLQWAVGQKLQRAQGVPEEDGRVEFEAKRRAILSSLGFIPGVIVQGHEWNLVLSTYENGKTKLWTKCQFGTTKDYLDIYAAATGMRQLAAWARDVYLPWFKVNVLDL